MVSFCLKKAPVLPGTQPDSQGIQEGFERVVTPSFHQLLGPNYFFAYANVVNFTKLHYISSEVLIMCDTPRRSN
jgi:hypothetical protein